MNDVYRMPEIIQCFIFSVFTRHQCVSIQSHTCGHQPEIELTFYEKKKKSQSYEEGDRMKLLRKPAIYKNGKKRMNKPELSRR